jgi:hypothetical protein
VTVSGYVYDVVTGLVVAPAAGDGDMAARVVAEHVAAAPVR